MTDPTDDRAGWRIAADIGGTFTDLACQAPDGTLTTRKIPSTPDDYARAIAEGKLQVLLTDHQTTRLAIYAVYPSRRHISLKLRSFVEHLKQSFGDTAPWDRALIKARQDVTTARDLSAPGAV